MHHEGTESRVHRAALAGVPAVAACWCERLHPVVRQRRLHHHRRSHQRPAADGNTIVTATEVQTLTGVLAGTFTAHDTGTIDGRTGSITISGASSGTGTTGTGQIVGDGGTGGLAGLHLQGTFQPVITSATTAEGSYSIQFHFDS